MSVEMIEAARAARKEALAAKRDEQYAIDIAALDALEIEHGDDSVVRVDVGRFIVGLPTMVVARATSKIELKRFRDRTKGERADHVAAVEEAAECAVLYPARDVWKSLCDAVPGLAARVGVAAVQLSAGIETAEGKG